MESVCTAVKNNKGGIKLVHMGYVYYFEKKYNNVSYWCCEEKSKVLCKSRLHVKCIENKYVVQNIPKEHCHEPTCYKKEVYKSNSLLKMKAGTSNSAPSTVISEVESNCPENCRIYLPKPVAQKKKIQRIRKKNLPSEPQSIEEIDIPAGLKIVDGQQFLQCEKEFGHNEKIILLVTINNLKLLATADLWLMDGTFKVVPRIMRQLFTIHGKINDEILPLVFCLMTSKSTAAYKEVFYEICEISCNHGIDLNPKYIISDFEKASVTAARVFFPSAVFKGCFFHFGKIIWRQIQKHRLVTRYANDEGKLTHEFNMYIHFYLDFSLTLRMLKCLAFLPAEEIQIYYESIKESFDIDVKKIASWLEDNYIYGVSRKRKHKGEIINEHIYLYKKSFWSISDLLTDNLPRTQNAAEAWHRRLNTLSEKSHAGLYYLIELLQKEQISIKTRINRIISGERKKIRKEYIRKENNILNILRDRHQISPKDTLSGLAINTSLF